MTKYELYRKNSLTHSAKGTGWSIHKYLSKVFKNGKWYYFYNKPAKQDTGNYSQYVKTNEYYTTPSPGTTGSLRKHTTYTRNGQNWLSSSTKYTDSSGNTTTFKTKGKIAQGIEKSAKKGAAFIQSLSSKASKAAWKAHNAIDNAVKKKQKNRIKVTYNDARLK